MILFIEQQNTFLYDILTIQKPWKNLFQNTTNHRLFPYFELAYLSNQNIQVCFFINKRLALLAQMVTYYSNDFLTLRLQMINDRVIYIHNIYNPYYGSPNPSSLSLLRQIMTSEGHESEQIIIRDFNFFHPSWRGVDVQEDQGANKLILLIKEFEIEQVLARSTITWRCTDSQSTTNLIFMTPLL